VIYVEQGTLGTFEQDLFSSPVSVNYKLANIRKVRLKELRVRTHCVVEGVRGKAFVPINLGQHEIRFSKGVIDPGAQRLRVKKILNSNSTPGSLVGVTRANPTTSCANSSTIGMDLSLGSLPRVVQCDVVRHDHMGLWRDPKARDIHTS
jgi:hypothetical protein